jgi:hypothetical protein
MPVLQGPSEVFRIVKINIDLHETSATESIPDSRSPLWGNQWAVTPKLTMIAGQQFSIGWLPV